MIITPINSFSLSIGTATDVRMPAMSAPARANRSPAQVGFCRTNIGNVDRLTGPDGVDRWDVRTAMNKAPLCHWFAAGSAP